MLHDMKKRFFILLAIVGLASLFTLSCQTKAADPEPQDTGQEIPDETPEEKPDATTNFKLSVPVTENWIFTDKPTITIHVENQDDEAGMAEAKVIIRTDKGDEVATLTQTQEIAAKGKADISFTTENNLPAGFYHAKCSVNKKAARQFTFGVNPMGIDHEPDMQPDFNQFWDNAVEDLKAIPLNEKLIELPKYSREQQKVYFVELSSAPDSPGGEPVLIHGYYLEPTDGKKYPVLIHFFGYDDQKPSGKLEVPYGSNAPEYAEFYLSHRGQYINNRKASQRADGINQDFTNIYGDWFAYNFGQKDSYYYHGAFLDCVQAVRFMASRESSDMSRLFGEGSSQGGALSYAAAALSKDYPFTAIAPCVAFLGDFPDYFKIVSWPGNVAKKYKGSMTDEEMYVFLSYFDTKNLATRISCPVMACSGLQDGTCPPHTNVTPFLNLQTPEADKEYYFFPEMGHEIPASWNSKMSKFFKARL